MGRFSFRKDIKFDLALLKEVESLNPFATKNSKETWDEIAKNLKDSIFKMGVTGRSCRERTDMLLKEFKSDENLSIKASGVEEDEMDEITTLLTSIAKLKDDKPSSSLNALYSKSGRSAAEKVRQETLNKMDTEEAEDFFEEMESALESPSQQPSSNNKRIKEHDDDDEKKKRTKTAGKNELVSYLENKNKAECDSDIRKEELRIKELEVENRRLELEVSKKRADDEAEDRKRMYELNKAKQDAEIKERQQMSELLMKLINKNSQT